jgi:hypothetical protein
VDACPSSPVNQHDYLSQRFKASSAGLDLRWDTANAISPVSQMKLLANLSTLSWRLPIRKKSGSQAGVFNPPVFAKETAAGLRYRLWPTAAVVDFH